MRFQLRHTSGPLYLHYEIIGPRFLRQHTDQLAVKGIDDEDVVVDSLDDVFRRVMAEPDCHATTIHGCMGTIMPISVPPESAIHSGGRSLASLACRNSRGDIPS